MRFWAEHPEDAERVAREGGDFNQAFRDHPDAQKAMNAVALARFLDKTIGKLPERRCHCRPGSPDACLECCDEGGMPHEAAE